MQNWLWNKFRKCLIFKKSLQMNRPNVYFYKDVWSERKPLYDKFDRNGDLFFSDFLRNILLTFSVKLQKVSSKMNSGNVWNQRTTLYVRFNRNGKVNSFKKTFFCIYRAISLTNLSAGFIKTKITTTKNIKY